MKRNLVLILAFIIAILFIISSLKKISSFRDTSRTVSAAQSRLDDLKRENEKLKQDLKYKESDQFAEEQIRDKLGLAKPGETVVILPQDNSGGQFPETSSQYKVPNWEKWRELFLGS